MSKFIPWNSQPLDDWAKKHAKGKFIDLNGRKTHYIEKGDGEPVILLHGFNYDSYMWETNIDILAEQFKVYALDLWGFGYSTREPMDYGYQLYVDQVSMFMNSLGIPVASFVGQSMGGGTAIQFCVQQRQKVNKLILVAPGGMPHGFPLVAKIFNLPGVGEFFLSLNVNVIRKKNLADFFIHNGELLSESYFENASRYQKVKGTNESALSVLRKQFFQTLSNEIEQLAKLNVPILIIWGREDKGIPLSCGIEMHQILKGSRLEILDNAGHVPNFERSDEFNKLSISFLQE